MSILTGTGIPAPNLESVRAKLRRADHHIGKLERSFKAFRDGDPYAISFDEAGRRPGPTLLQLFDVPGGPRGQAFGEMYVYIDQPVYLTPKSNRRRLMRSWGILVGDALHNLCGALDNFIWALSADALAKQTYPPTSKGTEQREADERLVYFPLCMKKKAWKSVCNDTLRFVDKRLWAFLSKYQPFYAWENGGKDPTRHPLYVVRELWNRDKHRFVHIVSGAADLLNARVVVTAPESVQLSTEPVEVFSTRPIEGKTEVGTIRISGFTPEWFPKTPPMRVDCDFTLHILLGDGSPAPGEDVIALLFCARNLVAHMLNEFV